MLGIRENICKKIIVENIQLREEIVNIKTKKQEEINRVNAFYKNKLREAKHGRSLRN